MLSFLLLCFLLPMNQLQLMAAPLLQPVSVAKTSTVNFPIMGQIMVLIYSF